MRIYKDHVTSTPYRWSPDNSTTARPTTAPLKFVMFSGAMGSAFSLDVRLYPNLHRMYYCKRHGYQFVHQLSNQFVHYFPHNTWEVRVRRYRRATTALTTRTPCIVPSHDRGTLKG